MKALWEICSIQGKCISWYTVFIWKYLKERQNTHFCRLINWEQIYVTGIKAESTEKRDINKMKKLELNQNNATEKVSIDKEIR